MSRGPKLEQIEDHDYPTFRIERERADGTRQIFDGSCELMESHDAIEKARAIWRVLKHQPDTAAIHIVNERTGFTRDTISRG